MWLVARTDTRWLQVIHDVCSFGRVPYNLKIPQGGYSTYTQVNSIRGSSLEQLVGQTRAPPGVLKTIGAKNTNLN